MPTFYKNVPIPRQRSKAKTPIYLSIHTLKAIRKTLTRVYNYAITELEIDVSNPAQKQKIHAKLTDKEIENIGLGLEQDYISHESFLEFVETAKDSPYINAFKLAYYTGLRVSETIGLKCPDIDLESRTLTVARGITRTGLSTLKTDTARFRVIPLFDKAMEAIQDQLRVIALKGFKRDSWLFPTG